MLTPPAWILVQIEKLGNNRATSWIRGEENPLGARTGLRKLLPIHGRKVLNRSSIQVLCAWLKLAPEAGDFCRHLGYDATEL